MTRPQIIRADTIDLQDHDAPSAKDHKHPSSALTSGSRTNGPLAPHQAETIREVQEERAEEEARSPRVSWAHCDGEGHGHGDSDHDLQQYADELASGIVNSLNGNNKMQQHDALAIAQNGGVSGHPDDEADHDQSEEGSDDDMMDKISSSPSIEDEDIDFEFVYALHTFVATVEGQANATKGDTMVLLDDSNSYWWLVRVVKDSSIGYLPAEHIETPTERLARLNKHRNVDLSATMLGDQSAPSKKSSMNPMKRRKTKTVTFTAPTYVDYSDFDYSDEEGDDEEMQGQSQATEHEEQQKQQAAAQQAGSDQALEDESAKVEPLKPRNQKQTKVDAANTEEGRRTESALRETINRNSDEFFDGKTERTTKNGTVRNTDSFFKDETIETKKITLTPGLLRDDNDARTSNDSKDLRQRPSFEKELVPDKVKDDKKKKEKKEKEKKPNAIRSFFSRKDKKKSLDDDDDSFGKQSLDAAGGFGDGEMVEEPEDMESSPQKSAQRSTGKLQKQQPRGEGSPTRKPAASSMDNANLDRGPPLAAEVKTNNMSSVPPATLRLVDSEREKPEEQRVQTATGDRPKTSIAKAQPKGLEPKPAQALKSKSRVELDDFDSSDEEDVVAEPTRAPPAEPRKGPSAEEPASPVLRPSLPGSFPDSTASIPQQTQTAGTRPSNEDRLSESPVEVSPITPSAGPPALTGGTLDQDAPSPLSSSSPELINDDTQTPRDQASMTAAAPTTTTPTWNDASLRAFFDSGSEIRDLLVVVYDKSDVAPVGPNHPIASALFREQNAKLAEISTQLDNMLGDWLARKQRLRGTV